MKTTVKKIAPFCLGVMAAAGLMLTSTTKANAWSWVDSSRWDTWSNGGYWVQQDIWGTSTVGQTIYANSYSNWQVTANYSGGGIKSYPAVGRTINRSLSSLGSLVSWYSASNPGGTSYDNAYDIWLNGSGYEVMIWQSWNGTQPIAGSYNAQGVANATVWNVNIGGATYNFYQRGTVFSFLRTSQSNSSWTDIRAVLQYLNDNHWFNNPTVTNVQFGWEIINTGGGKTYALNGYYCNFS